MPARNRGRATRRLSPSQMAAYPRATTSGTVPPQILLHFFLWLRIDNQPQNLSGITLARLVPNELILRQQVTNPPSVPSIPSSLVLIVDATVQ